LASEVRARVLAQGTFAYDIDDEEWLETKDKNALSASEKSRRARMKAETLGSRSASSPELLETLIPDLCSTGRSGGVYEFGRGIGRYHADMAGLLEAVRTHIESADRDDLSLIWVRGLLSGWRDTDPDAVETFLDKAINDVVWRNWFVELQVQADLDTRAVDRLLRVLDDGHCPTWQFTYLAIGRSTDPLTVSQITAIANKLVLRPDRGLFTAIKLLAMVIYCADKKDEQYKHELGKALPEFLGRVDWSLMNVDRTHIDHDLSVVLEFFLQSAESEEQIAPVISRMLSRSEMDRVRYGDVRKKALKPFFKYFPRLSLEMICIEGDDGTFQQATELVSDLYSERHESALELVPAEVLIDWCNEKPDTRYAFAADTCKLFEKQDDKKVPLAISNTAVALLAAAPDKTAVVSRFIRRFRPSVWAGSLADILEAKLSLLDQLAVCNDEAVRSEIELTKDKFKNLIDAERAGERKMEKSRYSSFE